MLEISWHEIQEYLYVYKFVKFIVPFVLYYVYNELVTKKKSFELT
jgi:hypothetical protein